ncbi:hypothetical protein BDV34DRAFT_40027 [Aspergillus parasiticus]|uniref:Uncharacterized protein n=1 Tax=Aspergillus parasiticus TaxID=5067 RepID=A0A5N6D2F4_ASPPA|nr:hypothetical protein BDV34DRAFT_40027 [Aspergillus parasiticus]
MMRHALSVFSPPTFFFSFHFHFCILSFSLPRIFLVFIQLFRIEMDFSWLGTYSISLPNHLTFSCDIIYDLYNLHEYSALYQTEGLLIYLL